MEQVSEHCPTPVANDETLVRLVVDPVHLKTDEEGTRVQSCFLDQMISCGASTLRLERAAPDEYHETARLLLAANPNLPEGKKRSIYGVVTIPVDMLRKATSELPAKGKEARTTFRAACVYATGQDKRPSHADILINCSVTHALSRAKKNRMAEKIANDLKGNLLTLENFNSVVDLSNWQKPIDDKPATST